METGTAGDNHCALEHGAVHGPCVPPAESPGDTCPAEGTGDLRSALAALRELRGTVELTAKQPLGQMAGQGAQSSQTAQYRPYKDVPFEDLVALVEKLDGLQEAGVVVDGKGRLADAGNRN